jgi:cobyrinic acid a,c-diamide synthase
MTGFFNCATIMTDKLQRFGYVEVEYENVKIKAHEFHHSKLKTQDKNNFEFKYIVKKTNKNIEWDCGLSKKNVLAGYPHIHFYSNFDFLYKIINLFRRNQK